MRPAVIAIVRDVAGRVLVVRRPEPPHEFALPGGHIEDGESVEAAAVREVNEETGIRITEGDSWFRPLKSPEDMRDVHLYCASRWEGIASPIEHLDVAWLTVEELVAQAKTFKPSLLELKKNGYLMSDSHQLDLGVGDVHVPGAMGRSEPVEFADLPAKKRNALPGSKFALPKLRKYPLPDANHTRNAASRLEQMHKAGKISPEDYASAKKRIAAAAKKFGIESEYLESDKTPKSPMAPNRLSVAIHHPVHGDFEIRHMGDGEPCDVRLPAVDMLKL